MTKQKEIREVIDVYTDDGCLFIDRVCDNLAGGYCLSDEEAYRCLMERLTEIGVVIKVAGELPDHYELLMCAIPDKVLISHKDAKWICAKSDKNMLEAGYTAVDPLIEE